MFGMLITFSSCESDELLQLDTKGVFDNAATDLKIIAPEPATVIKKIVENNCFGTSINRMFDIYLTPDTFAYYCGSGNSLNYHFISTYEATSSYIIYNSDQQIASFSLPGGTKYEVELYTVPGNQLVSTRKPFQLSKCASGFAAENTDETGLAQ